MSGQKNSILTNKHALNREPVPLRMHIHEVDETPDNHDDNDGNFGKTIVFTSKTTALDVHRAF